MSDGGRESGRGREKPHVKRQYSGDDFPLAIAKISVAQICESVGFQTFQQSALDTLSDIAVRYMHNIGKAANFYANVAGRTEGNIIDVIQGLEDLGSVQGFAGASDVDRCLASSGTVREIIQYVGDADYNPFAYSVPTFPVVKDRQAIPSFSEIGEDPPAENIPAWLPAFPDPKTYVQSPRANERPADSSAENIELAKLQKKMDNSLLNSQWQFACNGPEGSSAVDSRNAAKTNEAAETNPYLAPPLLFGVKDISPVIPPPKISKEAVVRNPTADNYAVGANVSVLEAFAPAIEAMKSRENDNEEGQKKILLSERPAVQFKIGIGKKSLVTSLDFRLQNKGIEKITPWIGENNEKSDKKRRAEQILKESIEKPQDLAHS